MSDRTTLPDRYIRWREAFDLAVASSLRPGVRVLDVGSGRQPTIPPAARPAGCTYVGLDLSADELAMAPGAYDETVVSDVADFRPELVGRFDLVLSLMVFEHVRDLRAALENIHAYLSPGGALVAYMSGAFAPFALANRILPNVIARGILVNLVGKDAQNVFPAHYDRCWYSALQEALRKWADVDIHPLYLGAQYLDFAPPLRSLYLRYEEWTRRGDHRNLASHYVMHARKPGATHGSKTQSVPECLPRTELGRAPREAQPVGHRR